MDRPKTPEEMEEYLKAVMVVAAKEWLDHDPLLSTSSRYWDIVKNYQEHAPFIAAIKAAFRCGRGEGFTEGYHFRIKEEAYNNGTTPLD
jgi:hypothetical protein